MWQHYVYYKIRCNLMHPLYGALPGPFGPVWVSRGASVAHWYTLLGPPRCRTMQYHRTFNSRLVSRWTSGFQKQGQCLFTGLAARSLSNYIFTFLFFHNTGRDCGVFGLIGC